MNHKLIHIIAAGLLALTAAACGSDDGAVDTPVDIPADSPADDPAGACLVGDEDCFETGAEPGEGDQTSAGMCAPDVTDCVDVVVDPDASGAAGGACLVGDENCYETGAEAGDQFPVEQAVQAADDLLGRGEGELPDDVRIARRGDETMALTEDYMLGRLTVELDDTDGSGYRVVSATVELPDGPRTVELTPG